MPSLSSTVARLERPHTSRKKKNNSDFLQHVKVIDFLEHLEMANISQATADEVILSCPFPGHTHGDETPSLYMNDGTKDKRLTTVWKCHGCGRSGNGISFYSEHEQISRTKAARWIKEHYAPAFNKPKGGIGKEFEDRREQFKVEHTTVISELKLLDWDLYNQFEVDWPSFEDHDDPDVKYMYERGFTSAELLEWRIGYDHHTHRITIPVCDPDGNLVGVKARALEKGRKPKYQILGDKEGKRKRYNFDPYEKSVAVFGIDKWGEVERYVLVEGEIDVMSLWKMGIPAICTGSHSVSDLQIKTILQWCDEIVVWFDRGAPGQRATWGYFGEDDEWRPGIVERTERLMRVRVVGNHFFDPNDYLKRGLQDRVQKLVGDAKRSISTPLSGVVV